MVVNTAICFVGSLVLSFVIGSGEFHLASLAWPILLAAGIGVFSGWRTSARIKQACLTPLNKPLSYMRVDRSEAGTAERFDWNSIDDYGVQLASRGFQPMGDFTTYPAPTRFIGVASMFANADQTILIEIQHIHSAQSDNAALTGMHFSLSSAVDGVLRVVTTDHHLSPSNYMLRGDNSVSASYPGTGLLALLDKHEQVLATLASRSGKHASAGLNVERAMLLQREMFRQARARLQAMSGYEIAKEMDAFEQSGLTGWAPKTEAIAALPGRTLEQLDATLQMTEPAPVVDIAASAAAAASSSDEDATVAPPAPGEDDAEALGLQAQVDSGASWFYWIAGLSLVNVVIDALGSNWSFVISLGITQLLTGVADGVRADGATTVALGLYLAGLVVTGLFGLCGWLARKPSVIAFILGMIVFGLDTLIFLFAKDWIGVAFHAYALYSLWSGVVAARALKQLRGPSMA